MNFPNVKGQMNASRNSTEFFTDSVNSDGLYSALVECFSVILCGCAAGSLNLISQRETKGLDVFVRTFALPSMIFLSLAHLDLSQVNWTFLASILISKSIVFAGVLAVGACLIRPIHLGKLGLFAVFCTQSNDFALGYPILKAIYEDNHSDYPSYLYLMAPISLAFLNPIAYVLLEIWKFKKEKEEGKKTEDAISSPSALGTRSINTIQEESSTSHSPTGEPDNSQGTKSGVKLCGIVFLKIIANPVMLMTVLGILGNFVYQYIAFVGVILKAFARVFSTTALFVLGLRMAGSMSKLKADTFFTPTILIITKLLVLPMITREIVSLLRPGTVANETVDLGTFGFLYGMLPTAPMVFVLSAQYDLELVTMSASLILCTFLSLPLLYLSAKTIFSNFIPSYDYLEKLESFQFRIGIIGIPLGVWLIVVFLANKSFNKIPHKISGFLIISQVLICIGVALQPLVETKPWFEYIQLSVVALGLYSSRLWTCVLALALHLLHSRSLCFVIKLMPFFIGLAWGVPMVLVAAVCFVSFPDRPFGSLTNPTFQFGMFQSIVTLILLVLCFIGTSLYLILQHRHQWKFLKYLDLINEINSKDLRDLNETNVGECSRSVPDSSCGERRQRLVDIEDIVSDNEGNACAGDCEHEGGLCSSKYSCTDSQRELCEETLKQYNNEAINEDIDEDHSDRQILRHKVLLVFLLLSMFVNLMLSVWTLVLDDAISGLYIEILFINVLLNIGQVFWSVAVFGSESRGLIVSLTNRWRKFYYGADTIVLTPVEELGFETTHVCDQFIAHHLRVCEKEIAKSKRLRLRMYKSCFKGRALVTWLQTKHLAKSEAEAVQYASHLLEGRVLRHVENRHHFQNSDLYYTFKK